jgi:hypothetical protein
MPGRLLSLEPLYERSHRSDSKYRYDKDEKHPERGHADPPPWLLLNRLGESPLPLTRNLLDLSTEQGLINSRTWVRECGRPPRCSAPSSLVGPFYGSETSA